MAKKGVKRDGSKSQAIQDYLKANPGANSKAVKDGLAKDGLSVSEGLVNKVKYSKPGKKKTGGRKATTRKAAAPKATRRGRPAAGGVNMSDAIRDYIAANPTASRPEIRNALQGQGVAVSNSLVNAVFMKVKKGGGKSAKRGRPGRPKTASRPAAAPASSGGNMSASELINAKQMVDQLGGIDKVRDALALLEQLQ